MSQTRNRSQISVDKLKTDKVSLQRGKSNRKGLLRSITHALCTFMLAVYLPTRVSAWAAADSKGSNTNQDIVDASMSGTGKQISAINLLLPIYNCESCRKVRQELTAFNGCYTWENNNPSLIKMTDYHGRDLTREKNQECLQSVFLQPLTMRETKTLTWITATDKNSGQVLRCQVKVGKIAKIDIQTRYRQLSVDENQMIRVAAFDDEGNFFSSLEGLEFDWTITKGNDVIKKMTNPDTGLRTSHETDVFFMKGVQAGFAEISVEILEPGYQHVPLAKVPLTIVDPFIILPQQPAYILPVSPFKFELAHLRMEENAKPIHVPISLPDDRYKWNVTEPVIGKIDNSGLFCSARTEGTTGIEVVENIMSNNTAEASIHVVYPHKLEVKIRDVTKNERLEKLHNDDLWIGQDDKTLWEDYFDFGDLAEDAEDEHILIEEHDYLIEMLLYEAGHNRIKLTENLRFESIGLDPKYFDIIWRNKKGSELIIRTKTITQEKYKVDTVHRLNEIRPWCGQASLRDFNPNRLAQDKDLIITKAVKILHPKDYVLLPFLPVAQEQHGTGEIWHISAKGGSGIYHWEMTDDTIAQVEGSIPAVIQSMKVGKTNLVVRDHRNWYNWDAITVEVAVPNTLSWIEEQSEIRAAPSDPEEIMLRQSKDLPIGEERTLSLVAFDQTGRKFTNCTAIRPDFEIKTDNGYFTHGDPEIARAQKYSGLAIEPKYDQIREYVLDSKNFDLLMLRQRFDEQKRALVLKDLAQEGSQENMPRTRDIEDRWKGQPVLFHNNFGICAQHLVVGQHEGFDRLRASFIVHDIVGGPGRLLESEYAEIAVYSPLRTAQPRYKPFFSDLYSVTQQGQEFQSFEGFYNDGIINMQFGNSIVWKVLGGTNFWQDFPDKYQSQWTTQALRGDPIRQGELDSIIHVQESRERATEFDIKVTCMTPKQLPERSKSQRVELVLDQKSLLTRHLLRPAQHQGKIQVHCEPPRGMRLLWAQENRTAEWLERPYLPLPRSRQIYDGRTHYVLVNSNHHVRYLMIDYEGQASLNHSSVATTVRTTNETMAEVSLMSRHFDPLSYGDAVYTGDYDKRSVQFKNITGVVYLQAMSSSYFSSYINEDPEPAKGQQKSIWWSKGDGQQVLSGNPDGDYYKGVKGGTTKFPNQISVSDTIRIEIVKNVDVEPKYKSIYIGAGTQTLKLRILHGSGHFSVALNNTALAEMVHRDRDIYLTPKAIGGLQVIVEDLELPGSRNAISEILITDIFRLVLDAEKTLIEKGDQVELTVTAYDNFMQEFEPDQYALMAFNIEAERTGLMRETGGLYIEPIQSRHPRHFMAYGKESGIYQLQAYTYRWPYLLQMQTQNGEKAETINLGVGDRHTIVSEALRIEVFPILEIIPNNLLITPNMRYTLQIKGGPQTTSNAVQADGSHVDIKFDIADSDKHIASVDQFREVTGHRVGDALLHYEIIQLRTQHHTKLGSLYEASQPGQLSKVVSKRSIPIRVRLVTDIEIPFADRRQIYQGSLVKGITVLKYNHEYFHHGIAPISYNWNCTTSRVLSLDLPTKQELAASHGFTGNLVQTSKVIRNGEINYNGAVFFSSFNSSAIYATAMQEGEAILTSKLAIEYPNEYRDEKNWFTTSVTLKITQKLSINVPQFSDLSHDSTHLYLLPPNTRTKIEANRNTRFRLGYSQQSVFDHSTQLYYYRDTSSPIIDLINDEYIRTNEKYGKVTVIVEEGQAYSDQIVMLNVLITDIYTMATMKAYDALNLPLGSSITLPIHSQNEHALKFADNIEGLELGVLQSHPRVVSVQLDYYNQTVTLESLGTGDCNVVIYSMDRQHIFDVIRVKVSSVVKPQSPVFLHYGGDIDFRVDSADGQTTGDKHSRYDQATRWSSSDPYILEIDNKSGKASAKAEGKVDVILNGHSNAASIVHISKIQSAVVDPTSPLVINTDSKLGSQPSIKVRVKFFSLKRNEEMMPTIRDEDGIILVRQNVDIKCVSENPDFVTATSEVNDLEGFFCVLAYRKTDASRMPRYVKIQVFAEGKRDGKLLYSEKVTDFEVQLTSEINIETRLRGGIYLNRFRRSENIKIYSSNDFRIEFDYGDGEESQLVLHQLNRAQTNSNEYTLTLQVPNQVSHSFQVTLKLSHLYTNQQKTLNVYFDADAVQPVPKRQESVEREPEQVNLSQQGQKHLEQEPKSASWSSYFLMAAFTLLFLLWLCTQICEHDHHGRGGQSGPIGLFNSFVQGQPDRRNGHPPRGSPSDFVNQSGVRDSMSYRKNLSNRSREGPNQKPSAFQPPRNNGRRIYLDDVSFQNNSGFR